MVVFIAEIYQYGSGGLEILLEEFGKVFPEEFVLGDKTSNTLSKECPESQAGSCQTLSENCLALFQGRVASFGLEEVLHGDYGVEFDYRFGEVDEGEDLG